MMVEEKALIEALNWAPIIISIVALSFTALSLKDSRKVSRLAREKELHEWCNKILEIYRALHSAQPVSRTEALDHLSLQIDYGRLLFPNETTKEARDHHPTGRRSSILDPLVETHRRCEISGDFCKSELRRDWRQFTDELSKRTTAFAINTSPEAAGNEQYRNP